MMGLFKRKKAAAPEGDAAVAPVEVEQSSYQAWSPEGGDQTSSPEGGDQTSSPEGGDQTSSPEGGVQTSSPEGGVQTPSPEGNEGAGGIAPAAAPGYAPFPLEMEEPQADAAELESIANAGTIEEQITAALKKVYDPEIPVDIYEMGLIYGVEVSEQKDVSIRMTLTSPGCPVAGQMPGMVEHAVQNFVTGVRDVEVEIVWDPPWSPDLMSEAARLELGFM